MTDIVERLRNRATFRTAMIKIDNVAYYERRDGDLDRDAATEIEALRSRNAQLLFISETASHSIRTLARLINGEIFTKERLAGDLIYTAEQIDQGVAREYIFRAHDHAARIIPTITTRNDEAGFTEVVNNDVPTVVQELDGPVAALMDAETRQITGYRVYDSPAKSAKTAAKTVAEECARIAEGEVDDDGGNSTGRAIARAIRARFGRNT